MVMVIDVGNTHVTIGIYEKDQLKAHWRLSSGITRTEDECAILIKMLCHHVNISLEQIKGCAISSVVPDLTPVYVAMSKKSLGTNPVIVNASLDLGLKILYHDPQSVGADRLCNAVAGFKKYGGPLIIVDLGTATTFDIVSENAEYLGGIIAPGVETSSLVLHTFAARLPKVELRFPESLIGRTTESSMQAGIMYGTVEMIDGLLRRLQSELNNKARVIATGGIAELICDKLQSKFFYEPYLTLDGLNLIYHKLNDGTDFT